jgi:hypothetical protein
MRGVLRQATSRPSASTNAACWLGALILVLAAIVGVVGCKRDDAPSSASRSTSAQSPRIVSLSPAITRTLVDLGLGDSIVGRTQFCTSASQSIQVVGSLLDIDAERLISTKPTHVLVQPAAGGMNPEIARLANERGWTVGAWRLDRLEDVAAMVRGLGETLRGAPFDRARLAERTTLLEQFVAREPTSDAPRRAAARVDEPHGRGRHRDVSRRAAARHQCAERAERQRLSRGLARGPRPPAGRRDRRVARQGTDRRGAHPPA